MATDNNDPTTPTYRPARHRVSLLHAHPVFVTKYRRPVFIDAMLTFTTNTMRGVGADLDTELVEFNGACVRARMRGHLWSPSYFTVSCAGAPLSIIKQHIDGQARRP